MAKEILVLTGSPRKGGNSDLLADAFIRGAENTGHTVHKFEAAFKNIHGCLACDKCWSKNGKPCVQKDDFDELAPLLEKCTVIVFASPVYYWGFTAQLKTAWDRFYAYGKPEGKKRIAIKESALLLTLGDTNDATYQGALNTYKTIAAYLGWQDKGFVVAKGVSEKAAVLKHEAFLQAETLGGTL